MSARARSLVLFILVAAGCDKKSDAPPPAPTAVGAAPTPAAPAPAATPITTATMDGEVVPTEEDFEEEAERGITAENLEAELDKLEREIGE